MAARTTDMYIEVVYLVSSGVSLDAQLRYYWLR